MKFEINFPQNSLLFEVGSTSTCTVLGRVPRVLLQKLVVQVLLAMRVPVRLSISVGFLYW